MSNLNDKIRIHSIVGHFGSGKTEFAVNYVLDLRKVYDKVAILDMDIANPYFRSRERQSLMIENDIDIHFNTYGYDINEDLPAITATVRAPLENKDYVTVVDVGGNDSGARIINQFRKYFLDEDSRMLAVVNLNRPDTETVELAIEQIKSIETETGIKIDGIINNTHMLRETTTEDILYGYEKCRETGKLLGIPVVYSTCVREMLPALLEDAKMAGIETHVVDISNGIDAKSAAEREEPSAQNIMNIYPITLQMRPSWLDIEATR